MSRIVLLLIHVTFAAILFGVPLGLVANVRRALGASDETLRIAAIDAERRGKMAGISSLMTLLTGIALIFTAGGVAAVSKNFHAALGLMLVALVFSAAVMRPGTTQLVAAAQAQPSDRPSAEAALKRLAMGSGVLHLLWVVMLALMFFRF